jgi:molybdenum cofactor biosynthesis enzyme MoaA
MFVAAIIGIRGCGALVERAEQFAQIVRRIGSKPETYNGSALWNCNIVEFEGQTFVVSHRAILTVVTVAACNAACRFCSNEITFTPSGRYLFFNDRVRRVKDFAISAGVSKVAYTGGEPTLNPQGLIDLMAAMNPGFAKARLHTNGFGLFHTVDADGRQEELLAAMIDAGLTGVSVSVAHFDPVLNAEIMRLPGSCVGMTADALRRVAAHASATFTPRLSCVLTHDGVHEAADIFDYIAWGRGLGFCRFIFRCCSQIPQGRKKATDFTEYNDSNALFVDRLAVEIARRHEVELTWRQRKSDSKVDVYRMGDVVFEVDESSEEEDPDVKIRRLNLMTNGVLYKSWIDPLAVVFDEDTEAARQAMHREFAMAGEFR